MSPQELWPWRQLRPGWLPARRIADRVLGLITVFLPKLKALRSLEGPYFYHCHPDTVSGPQQALSRDGTRTARGPLWLRHVLSPGPWASPIPLRPREPWERRPGGPIQPSPVRGVSSLRQTRRGCSGLALIRSPFMCVSRYKKNLPHYSGKRRKPPTSSTSATEARPDALQIHYTYTTHTLQCRPRDGVADVVGG